MSHPDAEKQRTTDPIELPTIQVTTEARGWKERIRYAAGFLLLAGRVLVKGRAEIVYQNPALHSITDNDSNDT